MRIKARAGAFNGIVSLPGDKSIAHRALLHASLAMGDSRITNLPSSDDVLSTLNALRSLKVPIRKTSRGEVIVMGGGGEFQSPDSEINCGNSGTTMRLLMGVLAGSPFESKLIGDKSLSRRPMERIAKPLRMMGVKVHTSNGFPPIAIEGKIPLKPIAYELPIASAQLKSALIYAALFTDGESLITEPIMSRDHTEIALENLCALNYKREVSESVIKHHVKGRFEMPSFETTVPGDPSSAAYLIALALLTPDSEITFKGILLNPRRIRYLEILKMMGGDIEIAESGKELGERVGDVTVRSSDLKNVEIHNKDVPSIIDEIPILTVIATKSQGEFIIHGAEELRVKESDRIASMVLNLRSVACEVEEYQDGLRIRGESQLHAGSINHKGDHRILMSLIVLSMVHNLDLEFDDLSPLSISFPEFLDFINLLSK